MDRILFSAALLTLTFFSTPSFAQRVPLNNQEVKMTCVASIPAAGPVPVTLTADRAREISTQWGLFNRSFYLDVTLEQTLGGMLTHITLRPRNASTVASYDMYLVGQPQVGQDRTLYGNIGYFPSKAPGPVGELTTTPLGFLPLGAASCTIRLYPNDY